MTDLVFVDSNVLVYSRDADAGVKREKAAAWLEHLWRYRSGRLSVQVLQEFYVTATRKLQKALAPDLARAEVRNLMAWDPIQISADILESAFAMEDRYRLSFWDALIVAASARAGCRTILSEDLQHGQDLEGVTVLNPFRDDVALP